MLMNTYNSVRLSKCINISFSRLVIWLPFRYLSMQIKRDSNNFKNLLVTKLQKLFRLHDCHILYSIEVSTDFDRYIAVSAELPLVTICNAIFCSFFLVINVSSSPEDFQGILQDSCERLYFVLFYLLFLRIFKEYCRISVGD